jgi:hypothetical protein
MLVSLSNAFDRACVTLFFAGDSLLADNLTPETARLWDDVCTQLLDVNAAIGKMIDHARREPA